MRPHDPSDKGPRDQRGGAGQPAAKLTPATLDINDIQRLLPHRPPFLLVDKIIEIESEKRIVGIKNVTINEPFFVGHFPNFPVMPGVLILEAMAQTGGVLLLLDEGDCSDKLMLFATIEEAKFRRPVVPGDQLRMELEISDRRRLFCRMRGNAYVEGQLAAEATFMCKLQEKLPGRVAPVERVESSR